MKIKLLIQFLVTYESRPHPANAGITHVDWAREKWGTEEVMDFNNYGWFQFNCVTDALHERKTLGSVLTRMGIKNIRVQPQKTFAYLTIDEDTVSEIVENAVSVLREWDVALPNVYNTFDNNPNRHMCNIVDL